MIKSSKLSVSIHDVEFAKDFQYLIEAHYEGVKVSHLTIPETNRFISFSAKSDFH